MIFSDPQSFSRNIVFPLSHTLEHNKYGEQMIGKTLSEWYRVLRPGGILLISVPDLSVLAR